MPGDFVLSENFETKDISKLVVPVTDPLNLEFDSKKTLGKLAQLPWRQLLNSRKNYKRELRPLTALQHLYSVNRTMTEVESADDIVRLMNFHLDRGELCYPELIAEFNKSRETLSGNNSLFFTI